MTGFYKKDVSLPKLPITRPPPSSKVKSSTRKWVLNVKEISLGLHLCKSTLIKYAHDVKTNS